MRPKTKQNARLMLYLTLCSIPFSVWFQRASPEHGFPGSG